MERKVKARKQHKCDACDTIIESGECYILDEIRYPVYSKETDWEEQNGIGYFRGKTCLGCYERRDLDWLVSTTKMKEEEI